jgi:hypothetical protein
MCVDLQSCSQFVKEMMMPNIQPIRHYVLDLAGKQIRGESRSAREQETLDGFVAAFPDLENPIFVRCSVEEHTSWGALVFPDEMNAGSVVCNIRFGDGQAICTSCGDPLAVVSERINLFRR